MKILATIFEIIIMFLFFGHCAIDPNFKSPLWSHLIILGMFIVVFYGIWH